MSFTNLYYKRVSLSLSVFFHVAPNPSNLLHDLQAVGTPKACYVCHKPTSTVLATINTVDFIYTCDNHLSDPGFASRVSEGTDEAKKPAVSADEIAKVKEEWEERQRQKKEKAKEKEKEKKDDKDKGKEKEDTGKQDDKPEKSKSTSPPASTPSAPTPTHEKYTLHRNMFSLRLAEHRKRRQTTQAKDLAPQLPRAPRGPP